MINITYSAKKYLYRLLSLKKEKTNIRISIIKKKNKNKCIFAYCTKKETKKNDIKINFNNFILYVDFLSVKYLENSKIDLIYKNLKYNLIITSPNLKNNKINKNKSILIKLKEFLKEVIKPKLLKHGGYLKLIKITLDMIVIVKFYGTCQGCSMIKYTFKNEVEKKIIYKFPEIKKVIDITNHNFSNFNLNYF
ncbi:MAG: NifU family protein [Candidatus Makana argininalis]